MEIRYHLCANLITCLKYPVLCIIPSILCPTGVPVAGEKSDLKWKMCDALFVCKQVLFQRPRPLPSRHGPIPTDHWCNIYEQKLTEFKALLRCLYGFIKQPTPLFQWRLTRRLQWSHAWVTAYYIYTDVISHPCPKPHADLTIPVSKLSSIWIAPLKCRYDNVEMDTFSPSDSNQSVSVRMPDSITSRILLQKAFP